MVGRRSLPQGPIQIVGHRSRFAVANGATIAVFVNVAARFDDLAEEAERALKGVKGEALEIDDAIESAISRAVKKAAQRVWERRPVVETTVLRL